MLDCASFGFCSVATNLLFCDEHDASTCGYDVLSKRSDVVPDI